MLYAVKQDGALVGHYIELYVYNLKSDVNENEEIIVPRKGHAKYRENITTKYSIVVFASVMVWYSPICMGKRYITPPS